MARKRYQIVKSADGYAVFVRGKPMLETVRRFAPQSRKAAQVWLPKLKNTVLKRISIWW